MMLVCVVGCRFLKLALSLLGPGKIAVGLGLGLGLSIL